MNLTDDDKAPAEAPFPKGIERNFCFEYRGINHIGKPRNFESEEAFRASVVEKYRAGDAGEIKKVVKVDKEKDLRHDFSDLREEIRGLHGTPDSAVAEENSALRGEVAEMKSLLSDVQTVLAELKAGRNGGGTAAPEAEPETKAKKRGAESE